MLLVEQHDEGYPVGKKTEWCGNGMVIRLGRGADLHRAQLMPLPLIVFLASVKSRLVLPFWGTGSPGSSWSKGC